MIGMFVNAGAIIAGLVVAGKVAHMAALGQVSPLTGIGAVAVVLVVVIAILASNGHDIDVRFK